MDANGNSLAENSAGNTVLRRYPAPCPAAFPHAVPEGKLEARRLSFHHQRPLDGDSPVADFTLASPIFHRLQDSSASPARSHTDPILAEPGWSSDCRELFEEGLRVLPVKFLQEGKINELARDFITANVRAARPGARRSLRPGRRVPRSVPGAPPNSSPMPRSKSDPAGTPARSRTAPTRPCAAPSRRCPTARIAPVSRPTVSMMTRRISNAPLRLRTRRCMSTTPAPRSRSGAG